MYYENATTRIPELPLPYNLGSAYILDHTLGTGTTGTVYHGVHTPTGWHVAAKILHPHHANNPDILTRFVQEKQLLTQLTHPHITRVLDMIVENNTLAIVTEYIDGPTLTQLLTERGTLTPRFATELIIQLLDALTAIHTQGIIHRDIKTDNILLTRNWMSEPTNCLHLTDFSVATILADSSEITGTPAYMAPEIFMHKTPTVKTDIYATAVTYYQLLAGAPPFTATSNDPDPIATLAHLHTTAAPPPLDLPQDLTALLGYMLAKQPHKRPSAVQALNKLQELLPTLENIPPLPVQHVTNHTTIAGTPTIIAGTPTIDSSTPHIASRTDSDVSTLDTTPAAPLLPDAPANVQGTIIGTDTRQAPPTLTFSHEDSDENTPKYAQKKILIIAGAILTLLAIAIGIFFYIKHNNSTTLETPLEATSQNINFPSGLSVQYDAQWDPETQTTTLTITYTSQKASLSGSFLETISPLDPDTDTTCPTPKAWTNTTTHENIAVESNNPTITNIDAPCTWNLTPKATISPNTPLSIEARIPMTFTKDSVKTDPNPLQTWLNNSVDKNTTALNDTNTHSTAYPAQRIQGIEVTINPRHYSTSTNVDITIVPIWPNGTDTNNPIFHSPRTGPYTSILTAIAGDTNPVHLYDECGGAISVTRDGEIATTQYPADNCHITATVGNFDNQNSNTFTITGNDS